MKTALTSGATPSVIAREGGMVARGPGSSWTGLLMRPAEEVRERGLALLGYGGVLGQAGRKIEVGRTKGKTEPAAL